MRTTAQWEQRRAGAMEREARAREGAPAGAIKKCWSLLETGEYNIKNLMGATGLDEENACALLEIYRDLEELDGRIQKKSVVLTRRRRGL